MFQHDLHFLCSAVSEIRRLWFFRIWAALYVVWQYTVHNLALPDHNGFLALWPDTECSKHGLALLDFFFVIGSGEKLVLSRLQVTSCSFVSSRFH